MKPRVLFALLAIVALLGCGDTGQPPIRHAATAVGRAASEVEVGDFRVRLDVAKLAFGPAYFCASRAASTELCPSALAEYRGAAVIDALAPSSQRLGVIDGYTGTVRSAGYALGLTWFNTQTAVTPTSAALGGHSAHLEGTATSKLDGTTFRFAIDVDVAPLSAGMHAVTATGVEAAIDEGTARLEVQVDPNAWLTQIDFAELATGTSPVVADPKSRAANAVAVGITTLAPPKFVWMR